ncbi:MAG: helix-turn-helix transcriptional regulator [Clostridiales Family XIII bacterium]|nr:helix-turn-helix transcriptional regulator [Clostridiales Family XIII bacterium]
MPILDYRITVYRKIGEDDFTENERDALEFLSLLIRKQYCLHGNGGRLGHVFLNETLQTEHLDPDDAEIHLGLSRRETEVALLLATGKSYQETADLLFISINTVRTHVCNVYRKLGIDNHLALHRFFRAPPI